MNNINNKECPICFEEYDELIKLICCKNCFCKNCIDKINKCPLCRTNFGEKFNCIIVINITKISFNDIYMDDKMWDSIKLLIMQFDFNYSNPFCYVNMGDFTLAKLNKILSDIEKTNIKIELGQG